MESLLSITTSQKNMRERVMELPKSVAMSLLRSTSSISVSATLSEITIPKGFRLHIELPVRSEVAESLERSLTEHAELWRQLS